MNEPLHILLRHIVEGSASPDDVSQARQWVSNDDRLPPDLRRDAFMDEDEIVADAVALLSLLTDSDVLGEALGHAVRGEAGRMPEGGRAQPWDSKESKEDLSGILATPEGRLDVSEAVMGRVSRDATGWVHGPVLAEAVRFEAGRVDCVSEVMEACRGVQEAPVEAAVRSGAGRVDVSDVVRERLGQEAFMPVAEAVRAEAGQVDVWEGVRAGMEAAGSWRSEGTPEDGQRGQPSANRGFPAWVGWAVAAVAVMSMGLWDWSPPAGSQDRTQPEMRFAMASEVIVEDLSYSDTVQVMQTEGDEGALIIWLDEEAVL